MADKPISTMLAFKTRQWLGTDGAQFFIDVKNKYDKVNAVFDENGVPHPVHFREGLQVRNFMRTTNECVGWDDHDYDDNWVKLIEMCIR